MLRDCIIDFKGNWDKHLHLVKFAYNNNFHSSIFVAPYEYLYGRRCRYPIGWFDVREPSIRSLDFIDKTLEKVHIIRKHLKMAYSRQKSYVDHRKRDLEF